MGVCFKLVFITTTALAILIGLKIKYLFDVPPPPVIEDTWWGPKDRSSVSSEIQTFQINFPEKVSITILFIQYLWFYIVFK